MKRVLNHAVLLSVLLLAAPAAAAAAPLLQADNSGGATYLPFVVVGVVLAFLIGRQALRKPARPAPLVAGESRNYGLAGGAVCRSCGLPFARDVLGPNLLAGKLTRCPHCGKWAVLPAASPAQLEAAEEKERQAAGLGATATATPAPLSQEEKLRRRIEESKYE